MQPVVWLILQPVYECAHNSLLLLCNWTLGCWLLCCSCHQRILFLWNYTRLPCDIYNGIFLGLRFFTLKSQEMRICWLCNPKRKFPLSITSFYPDSTLHPKCSVSLPSKGPCTSLNCCLWVERLELRYEMQIGFILSFATFMNIKHTDKTIWNLFFPFGKDL